MNGELVPRIGRNSPTAYAMFTDDAGEICLCMEGLGNRGPLLFLGYQHHKMQMRPWHVAQVLPLLWRFAHTGQIATPLEEDWVI